MAAPLSRFLETDASGVATLSVFHEGTPETARVRLSRGDAVLLDRVVTPSYSAYYPNGRSCGPRCEGAGIEFELGS